MTTEFAKADGSDITYIPTAEGWLYLAFTLDACSRRCVGHHCREDLGAELVITAFDQALARSCLIIETQRQKL